MATALYRKYRPQKFGDLTNQNHVKVTLGNQVAGGSVAHAYLFAGPRGVGKTTTARILAKALNCERRAEKSSEPCNECDACKEITDGRALDVLEIDAASHTGVDHVRENIIENLRTAPTRLKFKVYIIDEAHMLSTAAWNALLKTLEEPPAHVVFVLASTEVHKFPETILSRCQRFDFRKISVEDLVERLAGLAVREEVTVDRVVLERIARAAEGSVRDAEGLFGQILSLGEKKITADEVALVLPHSDVGLAREFLEIIAKGDTAGVFQHVEKLTDEGVDLPQFLTDAVEILRAALHRKFRASMAALRHDYDETTEEAITRLADRLEARRITAMIEKLLETRSRVKAADIPTIPLEIAAVELSVAASPAPGPGALSVVEKVEVDHSLDHIKSRWTDITRRVGEQNHALPLILNAAAPLSVESDILTLGVPYVLHEKKLMEDKSRAIIEASLAGILGQSLKLSVRVMPELSVESSKIPSDPSLQVILDTFGGKVIA